MFFEPKHSIEENEFRLSFSKALTFPLHIHRSFEFYAQTDGAADVTVGDRTYRLSAGDAVLIFPFQVHAYRSIDGGHFTMCIFSPDLAPDFHKKTAHLLPTDSLFSHGIERSSETDNIFLQRAIVYGIVGAFERGRTYAEEPKTLDSDLLTQLLRYADQRFREDCLLRDAAVCIGYDYAYASKFFKKRVGISFRQYVNLLRVNDAKRLLKGSSDSISEIKDACGFRCLRTFDREFFAVTGSSPSEYRRRHREQ